MLMFFILQITMNEIQTESLRKQLIEANYLHSTESIDGLNWASNVNLNGDKNVSFRESEAILVIKRLQEQVLFLSMMNCFCYCFSFKSFSGYRFL